MRKMMLTICAMFILLALTACQKSAARLSYPATKKVDQVDDYSGTKVADPYRWLEDDNAADGSLGAGPEHRDVRLPRPDPVPREDQAELTEIYNYPRYSSPFRAGEYYFFYKNDGLQNQSVIYIQKGLDGTPEVFFDPNKLSPDGTVRLGIVNFPGTTRYVALSRGEAGSDWSEIRIMESRPKKELPDRIRWVKFSGAAWQGNGFYYSRLRQARPGPGAHGQERVPEDLFHQLGEPQERMTWSMRTRPTRCATSTPGRPRTRSSSFVSVRARAATSFTSSDLTRKAAKCGHSSRGSSYDSASHRRRGRQSPGPHERRRARIQGRARRSREAGHEELADRRPGEARVAERRQRGRRQPLSAVPQGCQHQDLPARLDGKLVREIGLPGLGTACGFGGKRRREDPVLHVHLLHLPADDLPLRARPAASRRSFARARSGSIPADYETKQVFYPSKDGTRVPMFIVRKKGLKLDGTNPTYLRPTAASISR